MRNLTWKTCAFWILFTEAVGALSGFLSREGTQLYAAAIEKPPLSPPGILFPVVWSILYGLMGVGAARIWAAESSGVRSNALLLYFAQLGFNFFWSIIFFNLQAFAAAFFWLLGLWGLILWMTLAFARIDKPAAWMQVPYLIWAAFAGYLNFGVWMLN